MLLLLFLISQISIEWMNGKWMGVVLMCLFHLIKQFFLLMSGNASVKTIVCGINSVSLWVKHAQNMYHID